MRYKIITVLCVCVLAGGLCFAAAVTQAKTSDEDIVAAETGSDEDIVDTDIEEPDRGIEEKETENSENAGNSENSGNTSAGIQAFLDGRGADLPPEEEQAPVLLETDEADAAAEADAQENVPQAESEYADLAIANVANYVNVRQEPNADSAVVGKIYNGAVAQILPTAGEQDDWFQVVSGNVEGYIKAEYFLYGDAAVEVIDNYVTRYATVLADRLNVREEPDIGASRMGYIDNGEKVKLLENQGEWLKVQYTDSSTGYVAAEFVTISEEFVYAKTLEEEAKELAERRALEERQSVPETQAAENTVITVEPPVTTYSTNTELRQQIVDYAMQYLGNKYVHGGQSLTGGTDCSGFTSLIYADFGYSLSRTPAGQLSSAGRSIDYSEIQPGDVICYGSGKCTHVALYIGDGQIIHAANSRKGVIISNAGYDNILGVKNIID